MLMVSTTFVKGTKSYGKGPGVYEAELVFHSCYDPWTGGVTIQVGGTCILRFFFPWTGGLLSRPGRWDLYFTLFFSWTGGLLRAKVFLKLQSNRLNRQSNRSNRRPNRSNRRPNWSN